MCTFSVEAREPIRGGASQTRKIALASAAAHGHVIHVALVA
jgi:hypothetical protein